MGHALAFFRFWTDQDTRYDMVLDSPSVAFKLKADATFTALPLSQGVHEISAADLKQLIKMSKPECASAALGLEVSDARTSMVYADGMNVYAGTEVVIKRVPA